jgi:aromatic-L-amino-acid decarboxylase
MDPAIFHNDEEGRKAFNRIAQRAIQWIIHYYDRIETLPVRSQVAPGEIYTQFPDAPPLYPSSEEEVFQILDKTILPGITHWQHPKFFAFFPGNTSFPSITAEIITAGIAAQCMLWESSPVAAELEQRCMEWCRDLIGLPSSWQGAIQDTASTATLTALLTAREWKSGFTISEKGFDGTVYRIYASAQAHSSVEKAVRLAGFGTDNLVRVETDRQSLSMIPEALANAIVEDLNKGFTPVCVVSTIGTTGTGAIDPVEAVTKIAGQYGLWHHIDAAYAGTALMLEELSHLRSGIEGADSFVFNPHKWMFVQFDCSAYYVRSPELLIRAMSINPSYLITSQGDRVNDYRDWGIPLGRRFRALKLWMTLHLLGTESIKNRIRHHISLAQRAQELIKHHDRLEIAYPGTFNILTFRVRKDYDPYGELTRELAKEMNVSGGAYMTHAVVEGRSLIRWVIGQTYVEQRHVDDTWRLIQAILDKITPG